MSIDKKCPFGHPTCIKECAIIIEGKCPFKIMGEKLLKEEAKPPKDKK